MRLVSLTLARAVARAVARGGGCALPRALPRALALPLVLVLTLVLPLALQQPSYAGPFMASIPPEMALATNPNPALWEIQGKDSTVYLFGSVHVLKEGTAWMTSDVRRRFESSDEVWLEVPDIDDASAVSRVAQIYMTSPDNSLTEGLSSAEIIHLDALLAPFNLSSEKLKRLRKWAVGVLLETQQIHALALLWQKVNLEDSLC